MTRPRRAQQLHRRINPETLIIIGSFIAAAIIGVLFGALLNIIIN